MLNFKIDYNYVPFFPRETHQYLMTTKLCSASLHEPEFFLLTQMEIHANKACIFKLYLGLIKCLELCN